MKIKILLLLLPFLLFSQIQIDKVEHFAAGAIITEGTYLVVKSITKRKGLSIAAGSLAAWGAGYMKEYWYDRKFGGQVSKADFLYTGAGSLTVTFILIIK